MPVSTRRIERRQDLVEESRWRFSRTISLDSIVVLVVTLVSGLVFLVSMNAKIDQQAKDISYVQKSVERVAADSEKAAARLEKDQADRSARLETAIKETNVLVQSVIAPRLQR